MQNRNSLFTEKFLNQEINEQVKVLKLFIELPADLPHLVFSLATSEAFDKIPLEQQGRCIAALIKATEQEKPEKHTIKTEEKKERYIRGRDFCIQTGFPLCKNNSLCGRASFYCKQRGIDRKFKNYETYYPESVLFHISYTI